MLCLGQKGIAHILVVVLLLVGVGAGLVLIKNPAIFKPKASETSFKTINTLNAQCKAGAITFNWTDVGYGHPAGLGDPLPVKIRAAKNPGEVRKPDEVRTAEWWNSRNHDEKGDIILDLSPEEFKNLTGAYGSINKLQYTYENKDIKASDKFDVWIHSIENGRTSDPIYVDQLVSCGSNNYPTPPIGNLPRVDCSIGEKLNATFRLPKLASSESRYILRIDNKTDNRWDGTCTSKAGDFCVDQMKSGQTVLSTSVKEGDLYEWWYHEVDKDGDAGSASSKYSFNCSKPINESKTLFDSTVEPYCNYKTKELLVKVTNQKANTFSIRAYKDGIKWDGSCNRSIGNYCFDDIKRGELVKFPFIGENVKHVFWYHPFVNGQQGDAVKGRVWCPSRPVSISSESDSVDSNEEVSGFSESD